VEQAHTVHNRSAVDALHEMLCVEVEHAGLLGGDQASVLLNNYRSTMGRKPNAKAEALGRRQLHSAIIQAVRGMKENFQFGR